MVAEHFNGRFITNVEHPRAPLLYLKAIDALFDTFQNVYGPNCKTLPMKWLGLSPFPYSSSNLTHFLPSDSLPSREEVIWAIMLIHYLPDIYPDVPSDSVEAAWHVDDDFKADHKYGCARAAELWCWLYSRIPNTDQHWNQLTRDIETDAWRAIEYYQDPEATPKVPKKFHVSFVCIGHKHLHD